MKERTYYEAVEYFHDGRNMILSEKNAEGKYIRRFKTLEGAKRVIEKSIESRKKQYFYWRDDENKIIDKISYYNRYPLSYKIFKIIEQEEELYYCDNSDVELREPQNNGQEETTLWGR